MTMCAPAQKQHLRETGEDQERRLHCGCTPQFFSDKGKFSVLYKIWSGCGSIFQSTFCSQEGVVRASCRVCVLLSTSAYVCLLAYVWPMWKMTSFVDFTSILIALDSDCVFLTMQWIGEAAWNSAHWSDGWSDPWAPPSEQNHHCQKWLSLWHHKVSQPKQNFRS